MKKCHYSNIEIVYIEKEESVSCDTDTQNVYYLAKSDVFDTERIQSLINKGYSFHERFLDYIIDPRKLDEKKVNMIRADVREDSRITEDMMELASITFIHDRRFHLDPEFDIQKASGVVRGFMESLMHEPVLVYKCFHKEKLVGFTIIRKDTENKCENLLGAVDPDYQKKGAAFNLYVYMVDDLRKKGYESLIGSIASCNVQSLNLHLMLGATFSGVWDHYIKRPTDK